MGKRQTRSTAASKPISTLFAGGDFGFDEVNAG
jgi:hypothetical protein